MSGRRAPQHSLVDLQGRVKGQDGPLSDENMAEFAAACEADDIATIRKYGGQGMAAVNQVLDPATGNRALHIAASSGHREATIVLLELGARLRATNVKGKTAVDLATFPIDKQLLDESGKRRAAHILASPGRRRSRDKRGSTEEADLEGDSEEILSSGTASTRTSNTATTGKDSANFTRVSSTRKQNIDSATSNNSIFRKPLSPHLSRKQTPSRPEDVVGADSLELAQWEMVMEKKRAKSEEESARGRAMESFRSGLASVGSTVMTAVGSLGAWVKVNWPGQDAADHAEMIEEGTSEDHQRKSRSRCANVCLVFCALVLLLNVILLLAGVSLTGVVPREHPVAPTPSPSPQPSPSPSVLPPPSPDHVFSPFVGIVIACVVVLIFVSCAILVATKEQLLALPVVKRFKDTQGFSELHDELTPRSDTPATSKSAPGRSGKLLGGQDVAPRANVTWREGMAVLETPRRSKLLRLDAKAGEGELDSSKPPDADENSDMRHVTGYAANASRDVPQTPRFTTEDELSMSSTISGWSRAWMPFSASAQCLLCQGPFTQYNKAHHCHACGRLVCGGCSTGQLALHGSEELSRVCDTCYSVSHRGGDLETTL